MRSTHALCSVLAPVWYAHHLFNFQRILFVQVNQLSLDISSHAGTLSVLPGGGRGSVGKDYPSYLSQHKDPFYTELRTPRLAFISRYVNSSFLLFRFLLYLFSSTTFAVVHTFTAISSTFSSPFSHCWLPLFFSIYPSSLPTSLTHSLRPHAAPPTTTKYHIHTHTYCINKYTYTRLAHCCFRCKLFGSPTFGKLYSFPLLVLRVFFMYEKDNCEFKNIVNISHIVHIYNI